MRSDMTTFSRRRSILPALTFTAVAALCLTGLRAAPVDVLRFNIDTVHLEDTVFDDRDEEGVLPANAIGASATADWEYVDRRLLNPELGCVEAENTTGAFVFARLNRVMSSTGEDGFRCGSHGGVARNWYAVIKGDSACQSVANYDGLGRVEPLVPESDGVARCRVSGFDSPRIRVENLYAKRLPAETNIALLMKSLFPQTLPDGRTHGGYEIRTTGKGKVLPASTGTGRTVDYHGTAQLWEFIGKAKPAYEVFEFNVHMTFEKVTLP
jgi:hypothetical protein